MRKDRLAQFKKRLLEKHRQLADEVGRTAVYGKDQEDDSIKDLGDQANTAYTREFFFELGNFTFLLVHFHPVIEQSNAGTVIATIFKSFESF